MYENGEDHSQRLTGCKEWVERKETREGMEDENQLISSFDHPIHSGISRDGIARIMIAIPFLTISSQGTRYNRNSEYAFIRAYRCPSLEQLTGNLNKCP
jgi:hypothetical protein